MDRIVINGVKTFFLEKEKLFYSIGRSADCEISIPDETNHLSRWHATLSRDLFGEFWLISDGNSAKPSTAGITINGQRLPPNRAQRLRDNDIVVLTPAVYFVYYRGDEGAKDEDATYY